MERCGTRVLQLSSLRLEHENPLLSERPVSFRCADDSVAVSQPPAHTAQWIRRLNFGRFRGCYQNALVIDLGSRVV